jgi:hypothetical protein
MLPAPCLVPSLLDLAVSQSSSGRFTVVADSTCTRLKLLSIDWSSVSWIGVPQLIDHQYVAVVLVIHRCMGGQFSIQSLVSYWASKLYGNIFENGVLLGQQTVREHLGMKKAVSHW